MEHLELSRLPFVSVEQLTILGNSVIHSAWAHDKAPAPSAEMSPSRRLRLGNCAAREVMCVHHLGAAMSYLKYGYW